MRRHCFKKKVLALDGFQDLSLSGHVGLVKWVCCLVDGRGDHNRSDDAGRDGRHHVIAVHKTPFVPVRRAAQVVLAIVDTLATIPIFMAHTLAFAPLIVLHVGMVIAMGVVVVLLIAIVMVVLGERRSSCQRKRQKGNAERSGDSVHADEIPGRVALLFSDTLNLGI